MKHLQQIACALSFLFITTYNCHGQRVSVTVADTTDKHVCTAIHFLERYFSAFDTGDKLPDVAAFWSKADNARSQLPDDMLYTISSDDPTYRFSNRPTIFYAARENGLVHLKALFAANDTAGGILPWAITNHYVREEDGQPKFVSELLSHAAAYKVVKNQNITYCFPKNVHFDRSGSNRMLAHLRSIEKQWGFKPAAIRYYYAANKVQLAKMRGMDYNYNMDEGSPSGITLAEQGIIFCEGLGPGYLHEVLHIYFNPRYGQSPMCHALIYYLAGGPGHDFNWLVRRLNQYIQKYPETDLTNFENLQSKDPQLHIDYVVKGILCKMIAEKDGITGLKRALTYATTTSLLEKEFNVTAAGLDGWLKRAIKKYAA